MQKKIRKSFILLFSAVIAVLLFGCALMFMPKTTANADAEESGQLTDLYWGLDEDTGVLTLSSDSTNPATPNLYSALLVNRDNVPAWFYEKNNINSVTVDTYACAPQSMHKWFFWCENLTSVNLTGLDTSHTTDLGWMFYHCSGLTSLDLSGLDTANVTDMSYMFGSCEALASLNISDFDTSNVIDMSAMFDRCSELKTLDLSSFNTEKVKTMECMFFNCSGLTTLNVSNFNTANVTDMNQMFYGCSKLATIDISSFDISNVTDEEEVEEIFLNCDSLKEIKTPKIIGEVALPLPDSEKWWNGTADITTGSITSADAGKTIYRHAACSGGTATCTQKAICVVCGNEYGEVLGHSYGEWTTTKEATESEEGEERRVCENDNTHYETRTIPKLTPSTPDNNGSDKTPTAPAEEKKTYWWLFWLLIPLAIGVGGVTLGIWVYKNDKKNNRK